MPFPLVGRSMWEVCGRESVAVRSGGKRVGCGETIPFPLVGCSVLMMKLVQFDLLREHVDRLVEGVQSLPLQLDLLRNATVDRSQSRFTGYSRSTHSSATIELHCMYRELACEMPEYSSCSLSWNWFFSRYLAWVSSSCFCRVSTSLLGDSSYDTARRGSNKHNYTPPALRQPLYGYSSQGVVEKNQNCLSFNHIFNTCPHPVRYHFCALSWNNSF